jgi:peptide/nickel transport system permease protein
MWRDGLRLALRLALGLLGAALLAAAVLWLARPETGHPSDLLARLAAMLQGDFGVSRATGSTAAAELAHRLPATLELIGLGALVAFIIGVPLGLLLGASRTLRSAIPLIQFVAATPLFCVGLALIWSAKEGHWPLGAEGGLLLPGLSASGVEWMRYLRAIALPVLTVGLAGAGAVELGLSRALAKALDEPYRRGLRRFGLSQWEIDLHYVVPQVVAGFAARSGSLALALVGAVAVTEWVFQWPGVAALFIKSVALQDWPLAAVILFLFAAFKFATEFAGALAARVLSVALP